VDTRTIAKRASQQVLSRAEFEALISAVPPGQTFDHTVQSYTDPDDTLTIIRSSHSIEFRSSAEDLLTLGVYWHDEVRFDNWNGMGNNQSTADERSRMRATIERFLAAQPALDYDDLAALELRLERTEASASWKGDEPTHQVWIHDGTDGAPRGVLLHVQIDHATMERYTVTVDDEGWITSAYLTGPMSHWSNADDNAFTPIAPSSDRRARIRDIVESLLLLPVMRGTPKREVQWKNAVKQLTTTALRDIVDLLTPALQPSRRRTLRTEIIATLDAAPTDWDPQGSNAEWLTPSGVLWEALLERLSDALFLITFDRQQPESALERCRASAAACGIERRFRPEPEPEAALDMARTFHQWLDRFGFTLLWPQGGLRNSGDDEFLAVIVEQRHVERIIDLGAQLGWRLTKTP
jgi:hypothetical protein